MFYLKMQLYHLKKHLEWNVTDKKEVSKDFSCEYSNNSLITAKHLFIYFCFRRCGFDNNQARRGNVFYRIGYYAKSLMQTVYFACLLRRKLENIILRP